MDPNAFDCTRAVCKSQNDGPVASSDVRQRPLRILFVSNLFPDTREPYRGLDNATVLHALRRTRLCEIRVLSPRPWLPFTGGSVRCLEPRAADGCLLPKYCKTAYVPRIGSWWNHHLMRLALAGPIRRLRREFSWDVLLASWLYPDGWAAVRHACKFRTPCVLIAQGSDVHRYLLMALRRRLILEAIESSAAVITRSRSLASLLRQAGADSAKLRPISNGIDTRTFHPRDRSEARVEMGIAPDARVLLFVGNFLPVKDPLMLIRAFRGLRDALQGKNLHLVLVGKGPLRPQMERLARELNVFPFVTFTGPLEPPEVARWMQVADVFCMTSQNEGLPNVILEAQACGLPVVSTDVGGIHELMDAPEKGLLVSRGDRDAWVKAAATLIEQPPDRNRIAAAAMQRDWSRTAQSYWDVLRSATRFD